MASPWTCFHSSIKRMEDFAESQAALSQDLRRWPMVAMEVFAFSCEDSAGRRRSGWSPSSPRRASSRQRSRLR